MGRGHELRLSIDQFHQCALETRRGRSRRVDLHPRWRRNPDPVELRIQAACGPPLDHRRPIQATVGAVHARSTESHCQRTRVTRCTDNCRPQLTAQRICGLSVALREPTRVTHQWLSQSEEPHDECGRCRGRPGFSARVSASTAKMACRIVSVPFAAESGLSDLGRSLSRHHHLCFDCGTPTHTFIFGTCQALVAAPDVPEVAAGGMKYSRITMMRPSRISATPATRADISNSPAAL